MLIIQKRHEQPHYITFLARKRWIYCSFELMDGVDLLGCCYAKKMRREFVKLSS